MKRGALVVLLIIISLIFAFSAYSWTPLSVKDDPLVRMPGSQPPPENMPDVEGATRCTNCHGSYNITVEPAFNWKGSMMAQAGRDFLFWSCLTVAAQDSIYAIGRPNATDICLRCHMPDGWLAGRSDPTNGSAMRGTDFDGVSCDFCHSKFDPFFESTYNGTREGSDWLNYWDETNQSSTSSRIFAYNTYIEDLRLSKTIKLFNGSYFYNNNLLPFGYLENGAGQYFVDDNRGKRGPFADASARHPMYYSRYHKSKYFCSTCHDVSNPVLANLILGGIGTNET
ncbi:MAG: cytochrome c family protein, partial [Proteobacteria bacterium]|nr:cytochrome c family protein [Pseudomonadota bacterium]